MKMVQVTWEMKIGDNGDEDEFPGHDRLFHLFLNLWRALEETRRRRRRFVLIIKIS